MNILEQIQRIQESALLNAAFQPFNKPDAVCMSRKNYENLVKMCTPYLVAGHPPGEEYKESVFGLRIFVDDEAPDSFIEVGESYIFSKRLNKKKLKF